MSIVSDLLVTVLTCLHLANAANVGGNSGSDLKSSSIDSKGHRYHGSGLPEDKDTIVTKSSSTYAMMLPFAIPSAFLLFIVALSFYMLKSKRRHAKKKVVEDKTSRDPLVKKDWSKKGERAHIHENLYVISESDEELSVDNNSTLLRLAEDSEDDELVVAVDGVFSI